MTKIKISTDFSTNLGGRYKKLGDYSGEEFYDTILKPKFDEAKNNGSKLIINLDGASPYGSSFLDETFGKLKREYSHADVDNIIDFQTENFPHVVDLIKKLIWEKDE